MEIFSTYLYEVLKGTKNVALVTILKSDAIKILGRIKKQKLDYYIQEVSDLKTNIFFGRKEYIDVIKILITKPLTFLNNDEDFILGILLGYSIDVQCKRYIQRNTTLNAC